MKTLTLKKVGYVVKGMADLKPWGGGNACIEMTPFKIKRISDKILMDNINDAGFGVENINGAICDIYEDYEGTLRYLTTKRVGKVSEHTEVKYDGGQGYCIG
uniref:Uncharacterized protein n=1 Tax=viral metagenome TaxID=1070528 RepID=A0A6M3L7R5_9ZZZZ